MSLLIADKVLARELADADVYAFPPSREQLAFSPTSPISPQYSRPDSPCSGRRQYDSDSDHWKLRREADAELTVAKRRISLVSPFVSLVCALPPRARVNMLTAERWAKNLLRFTQNIRNLPNLALVSPQTSWILCPDAVSGLRNQQVQGLGVGASQTLGVDAQERSRREEPARTGRPLATRRGRA